MPRSVEVIVLMLWLLVMMLLMGILAPITTHAQGGGRFEIAYGRLIRLDEQSYVIGRGLVLTPPSGTPGALRLKELKGRIISIKVEVEE